MQAFIWDFINLLLRWLHVIAAIAWIGESIYFVMLDNSLRQPKSQNDIAKGVGGEMWAVHGGGFYHNQKYTTSPENLPQDLHWSFWKAYTTWLSGFSLFCVAYLMHASFNLVNPNASWEWASHLTGIQAGFIALLFLFGGWLVYNQLCKTISPNMTRDGILSIAVAILMVIICYLAVHIFAGRAAFLLIGAVMATCMSANVFFWIIPGQRRMVQAMKTGQLPNPLDGKRGKQRSVHNTYFTLPVVFMMISNHYAITYGSEWAWVVAVLFILAGASIRQFFVLMHAGKKQYAYWIAGIIFLLLIAVLTAPKIQQTNTVTPVKESLASTKTDIIDSKDKNNTSLAQGKKLTQDNIPVSANHISVDQALAITHKRCIACHAQKPSAEFGFPAPPLGLKLETADEIIVAAPKIAVRVSNKTMPLGNVTHMTDEERTKLVAWARSIK